MVVICYQQEDLERWKGKSDLLEGKDLGIMYLPA